jgi:hypothetical protein
MMRTGTLGRRLQKLEFRRQEERSFALMPGEARRLMEEKLDAVRRRMQPAIDSGEYEAPDVTAEQVAAMLRAHLEESRILREQYEKRCAVSRWGRASPGCRSST